MRIIQSAWACNKPDLLRNNSGWLSPEYNLMSWTLSCLQLKQYYPELVLYCDSAYRKLLIDTLELPYSDVVCNLDILNKYHPQLWALPKIHSYSKQEKPFLHVDGDVFIWKKFEDSLLSSELVTQNKEAATDYYEKIMISLESALNYFPDEIQKERKSSKPILAYNAGIFGGSDISFFKEYTSKAFEFVNKNILNLSKINVSGFNIFFEQYLFYCLARKYNKKVNVLLSETIGDNQYKGFGDFARVPYEKQYLHLLGNYKKNEFVCKQMAARLRQDYPEYYYRIIDLFKKNKVILYHDYYNLESTTKDFLVQRYIRLNHNAVAVEKQEAVKALSFDFKRDLRKEIGNIILNKEQFIDFEIFNSRINSIIKIDFLFISKDYLYARDCFANFYFQYLFEDKSDIYNKKIVRGDDYRIIKSDFNWSSFIEKQKDNKLHESVKLEKSGAGISTLIIPECDQNKFSLTYIDELDLVILEILKTEKTIRELFDALEEYFDTDELFKIPAEFENLIFGRIKLGIHVKSIKAIID
ncbi:hypothetical protein D0817_03710 [Flavobacterium cupreum]|uniref:DUF6734 domain-containing protein n=2 Tax=Flavobacterium TaxID=237 RepID=A0A434ABW9_9FLAO|nr:DUF6734 family protein [Flavobacterium cupreum]RUT71802.1 hypothetical protein D0817_03710 [Flavobacterium cupreum]